ncbi:TetR/AcrR family transcriptional regulator [Agromyces archimandritae]|uniref:TetR/AcrR family transcriptional regulator n=1 Tax=Agromyces archimandritae TaxID=2781962 RepID=A0A975FKW1_9MICO|nr:TetR/AcrR family transcriptional regulator [Agromyces archimandritae]QTX03792.1 TetR/AcrR family transcriptional regulator [Agromyces archimandritae]
MGTTSATASTAAPRRTRPKDRKQRIAMAAATLFSERGYHQVSLGEVAAEVGISAPALYRHFPNKYALFLDAAERLVHGLLEVTEPFAGGEGPAVDAASTDPARTDPAGADYDALVHALVEATIDNRRTGGLYRWEGRYLHPDDRRRLGGDFAELGARVRRAVQRMRPGLGEDDARMIAAAALSVVASITSHHASLGRRQLAELLGDSARDVADARLPAPAGSAAPDTPGVPPASKRELIVREGLRLFQQRGYHETSIEELSAAVGLTQSGFYRHFASKSELLLEACVRAAERLGATTADALEGAAGPAEALDRLIDGYIAHSFTHHELMSVYFSDIGALPGDEQERLRGIQRRHVDEWVGLLRAVHPDLTAQAARFRVHAGLNVVVDLGRLVHFDDAPATRARVACLVRAALGR